MAYNNSTTGGPGSALGMGLGTVSGSASNSTRRLSRSDQLRRDWLRFLTFCRLCTMQLLAQDS
jgi:hypothetical protein